MTRRLALAGWALAVAGTLWLKGMNWGRPTTQVDVLVDNVAQLAPGWAGLVVLNGAEE